MRRTQWLGTNEEGGRGEKRKKRESRYKREKIPVKLDPVVDATLGLVMKRVDLDVGVGMEALVEVLGEVPLRALLVSGVRVRSGQWEGRDQEKRGEGRKNPIRR
jgi:hypothetical protein